MPPSNVFHHRASAGPAVIGVILLACATGLSAEDWPQFRGPNCSGVSLSKKPLPADFAASDAVRWTAEVGDGVGSAVVAAGRVFVSGMTGEQTVSLFAFDAASGKKLWQRSWPTGRLAWIPQANSHASTTPAADARRVYFYFSTLGLLALDARSGRDVWHQKLPPPFFVFKWGPGMSPVLYRDLVLFCQDDDLYPAIYAFDRATGKMRWKDDRTDMAVNYSHPVVCTTNGRDDIVVAGTGMLIGYDPASGKRQWYAKTLLRNIKTTPVCVDGVIYISILSTGIANQWLASADQTETGNNDGKLTKAEIQAYLGEVRIPESFFKKTFDVGDLNKDGVLEGRELDVAFLHPSNFAGATYTSMGEKSAEQFILAVRGAGQGNVTDSHVLWKHATKHTDHIVSPFISEGRMLLVKEGGISTVFDTKDGKPLRAPQRIENVSSYFASPVSGDGKIYVAGENGVVVVLKNSPNYEVLAKNDLGESILATPAIADGSLFIRTRTKVHGIRSATTERAELRGK
ncbi:MAG: serine/threonine protein kinase [Acidimicrobiia bacterium]|nr:serine/threonine protein kinase [Acidimicrobiia bacterium]